ncbi:MAG TPA: OsmC family protein [Vicinamibacteria bacterium]|nr:OsmC family protein [Vicinamibacteria bacterium]
MPSIESSGFPLVFKVRERPAGTGLETERRNRIEVAVRSLEGMQKEALVSLEPEDVVWRLVSDEGPYLNGKDMAPFPLAFFSCGMQFSFMSELLREARCRDVVLDTLSLEQDSFYSLEGSFLRGDARGGAKPAELRLSVRSSVSPAKMAELVQAATTRSPAEILMRTALRNTFSLISNGMPMAIPELPSSTSEGEPDPGRRFESIAPTPRSFRADIIERVKKCETVVGVEGGLGSSLRAEQKRTLHIHGEARWLGDLSMESLVYCYKPISSSFRFVCGETRGNGGHGSAPPPLAYLSAGIGFCYMTQLGRYAHIKKMKLDSYRIVQQNTYLDAGIEPVDTQVFLDGDLAVEDDAASLVRMGERTCFLHAAMRGEHPSRISVELNGEPLAARAG